MAIEYKQVSRLSLIKNEASQPVEDSTHYLTRPEITT